MTSEVRDRIRANHGITIAETEAAAKGPAAR
jgi:hypothetical protein